MSSRSNRAFEELFEEARKRYLKRFVGRSKENDVLITDDLARRAREIAVGYHDIAMAYDVDDGRTCGECGHPLADGWNYCPECGSLLVWMRLVEE